MRVLGIDPGFSSMGWAIADVAGGIVSPIQCGVIITEKNTKKTNTRSSEDNILRAKAIQKGLQFIVDNHGVRLIATETMSWPRNAGVVAKMGIAWGVIASIAGQYNLPVVQAAPMILKRKVTGNGKASKEEMIAAISSHYPDLKLPKNVTLQEHAADAVAAIVSSSDSELMQFGEGF